MNSFNNIIDKLFNVRLIDVFLLGPLQILIASSLKNKFLKVFLLITGILNILYNGHNYLYFDIKYIKNPFILFKLFLNKLGKSQNLRLYNLLIMYPIFTYIFITEYNNISDFPKIIFISQIIVGIIYNFNNYINYPIKN